MNKNSNNRLQEIFDRAGELAGAERSRYLDEACGDDRDLRERVESLLAHDDEAWSIGGIVRDAVGGTQPVALLEPGTEIDAYRIARHVGSGGMGDVYEAQQLRPVQRRVALKLIKPGMDSREVVSRFESERQALALMDHAAIARVFDGGATTDGRPYFVMEYVDGARLTDYCDEKRLDTAARLELFMRVCGGVQHAHRRGILHRDLKPSNILVSEEDGQALPKVIDFGIARAIDPSGSGATRYTRDGEMIGTPEYMSPERAEGRGDDTRSDVYSLGVLLYELLVGARPFDLTGLQKAGFEKFRRLLATDEPSRPSRRVVDGDDTSTEVARRRGTDPGSLRRRLSGDLDWITMRALEKDPERRYGSPKELADDIRRHLEDQPVLAGPPEASYRVRKFVRRHRWGVAVAATIVVLLVVGVVGISTALVRAVRAEAEARREAETSRRVVELMTGMFEVADPGEARGASITAKEILDRAAEQIDGELQDEPRIRADLMETIAEVYRHLGLLNQSRPLIESALEVRRGEYGEKHPEVARTMRRVGALLDLLGEGERAEAILQETLAMETELHGVEHTETASTMQILARLYTYLGRFEEAEELAVEALAIHRRVESPDTRDIAETLNELGIITDRSGRYEESERYHREALEMIVALDGENHPDSVTAMTHLAGAYQRLGRMDEAGEMLERALRLRRELLGDEHLSIGVALNSYGLFLRDVERYAEAEEAYREALSIWIPELGLEHSWVMAGKNNLAQVLHDQDRLDEAEALFREVVETEARTLGPDNTDAAYAINNLGMVLKEAGRLEEAERMLRRSLELRQNAETRNEPILGADMANVAAVLILRGNLDEAEPLAVEALGILRSSLGADHPDTVSGLRTLAELHLARGRPGEAEPLLREARAILVESTPDATGAIATIDDLLAACREAG